MRIEIVSLVAWALSVHMLSGCVPSDNKPRSQEQKTANDIMTAKYTSVPVVVDGILNEPVWQEAVVYSMQLPVDCSKNNELEEVGQVRLAWSEEYFYVGVKFDDSDIVA